MAPIWRCCNRRCSTATACATPSSTVSGALRRSSPKTWRRRSAAPSTTGSRSAGSRAIRGSGPRSWFPAQNPELAAEEITRRAGDRRFVQVLVLAGLDLPLGRRHYWPLHRACEAHGLPLGIHAGSAYRHPPSASGWPSYLLEDYVSNTQLFCRCRRATSSRGRARSRGARRGFSRSRAARSASSISADRSSRC
ncbi:MAG: amidohydrolase family protein [Stellaceae bacterium]